MRTASLSDTELRLLLEPVAHSAMDERAQLAVRFLVEEGMAPRVLARLTTTAAMRLRFEASSALSMDLVSQLERALERNGEWRYLLSPEKPLEPDGLRWLCRRYGSRRGVEGVTPERLRRTWLRLLVTESGLEEASRRAGLTQKALRRQLRADPRATRQPPPELPATHTVRVKWSARSLDTPQRAR